MVHAKAGLAIFLTVSLFEEIFEGKRGQSVGWQELLPTRNIVDEIE